MPYSRRYFIYSLLLIVCDSNTAGNFSWKLRNGGGGGHHAWTSFTVALLSRFTSLLTNGEARSMPLLWWGAGLIGIWPRLPISRPINACGLPPPHTQATAPYTQYFLVMWAVHESNVLILAPGFYLKGNQLKKLSFSCYSLSFEIVFDHNVFFILYL